MIKTMKHNFFKIALVAAVVVTVGHGVYENRRQNLVSNIMLANVEALADDELSNGRCWASWYNECCVCGNAHFTYAYPTSGGGCDYRYGCSHY